MVDYIPVFGVRSSQIAEVRAGVLASHRFNIEVPTESHLDYTAHTVKMYQTLKSIIDGCFPGPRQKRVSILDVGGGRGELALLFGKEFDTAMIDVDLFSAKTARVLQRGTSGFRVLCGDCSDLPIESQSVDVLISKETAHHMADPKLFFREMARVVQDEGLFIVVEPVQGLLANRKKSLANDRMRQLGATHHHFYLREIAGPLKRMFAEVRVVEAQPGPVAHIFGRFGLSGLGKLIDRIILRAPHVFQVGCLRLRGGSGLIVCRHPIAGRSQQDRAKKYDGSLVEYPVELASVEPIPEATIQGIQQMLLTEQKIDG